MCFFNDYATTEIYTLSLHDALPILLVGPVGLDAVGSPGQHHRVALRLVLGDIDGREKFLAVSHGNAIFVLGVVTLEDRKSTRLNSSHTVISYAVFCLKKKNN